VLFQYRHSPVLFLQPGRRCISDCGQHQASWAVRRSPSAVATWVPSTAESHDAISEEEMHRIQHITTFTGIGWPIRFLSVTVVARMMDDDGHPKLKSIFTPAGAIKRARSK